MSSLLELALDLVQANETMRNRKEGSWPKKPGISWFRFFLLWCAVEAAIRWVGPFAFPEAHRWSLEVNLALLFLASPIAWLMVRQFAGSLPSSSGETAGAGSRTSELTWGLALGALALGAIFPLEWIDTRLFGPQPPIAVGKDALTLALIVGINGLWVPVFEELAWRGRLQSSLQHFHGAGWALAGGAILFSLKHAVVDASPGRLVTLLGVGLVLGFAYQRGGIRSAVVAHIVLNTCAGVLTWLR
jgi:membrane protease YdiL (CAAX protease family)